MEHDGGRRRRGAQQRGGGCAAAKPQRVHAGPQERRHQCGRAQRCGPRQHPPTRRPDPARRHASRHDDHRGGAADARPARGPDQFPATRCRRTRRMNSLSKAKNFVADAFLLAPVTPFVPENIKLGEYTFLPWVRTGLAAAVTGPAAPAEGKPPRANATIHVKIEGDNGATKTVDKDITLRGPGDVVGIDPHEIVRRVPAPNSFNVEESFLAHVEFNRPELPWLFSPFALEGNDQLRPWLALVVCEAERATVQPGPAGLPQQLLTHRGELQPLDDAWAWAHAQVIGPKDGAPTVDDRLTEDYAPTNLSRIL